MSTGGTRAPLPQLTAETEFFWTSGADDTLRIQECRGCAALIHPPQPVCRYCGGHDPARGRSAGRGVVGVHRQPPVRHPGLAAPYVVAQVAIREDPRVRLTTNIVDADPDDLEIGQLVEVVFEKNDDVYLPLFRPLTPTQFGEQPADEIAPQDFARHVRPPLMSARFEERSAITGIGASRLGRRLMVNPLSLTVEACEAAVADAGLTFADIDGLSTYPGLDVAGMGEGGVTALEGALRGLRPTWINGAWTPSVPVAR